MAEINIGQISEALNDKADRDLMNIDVTSGADIVVDFQVPTAENNYTWYRKYKSGWVEQGGLVSDSSGDGSASLPIAMLDTNYYISAINEQTSNESAWGWVYIRRDTKTTTGFGLNSRVASGTAVYLRARWMVCGMAAN